MRCPECNKTMKVTHVYEAGPKAFTRRLECPDGKCGTVATCTVVMENVNPGYGQGAAALAKKLRKKVDLVGTLD